MNGVVVVEAVEDGGRRFNFALVTSKTLSHV